MWHTSSSFDACIYNICLSTLNFRGVSLSYLFFANKDMLVLDVNIWLSNDPCLRKNPQNKGLGLLGICTTGMERYVEGQQPSA
jgi:hypothetical protein